jgi:CRISPR-associated endonuclease/helicase Cas3
MTFDSFYEARRGFKPFPWMVRLARLFKSNALPDVIDLPTGSGKSDVTLIWAWARTQNASLPRRLWMVSDRRVIVDQTYDVAKVLAADGILVSRLRGGIETDTGALLDPVVPQIITATVDQFGSRLLFRGYGAGPRSWPMWAGLAGNDSLIMLDEAHLSPVAEETFRACQKRLRANIRVISMTATPPLGGPDRFSIDEADRADPELGQRLRAKRIVELRNTGSLEGAAAEFIAEGRKRVALICNTVREARRVFGAVEHDDKYLIIGRQRPLDRDDLLSGLYRRVRSGASESAPLVVVATQCIEAGADFDFDAMATEACPIDALRQRVGRLDRLGRSGQSSCIMLKPPPGRDEVPPYGPAPIAAWRWLTQHAKKGRIDLGGEGWSTLEEFVPEEARSARPEPVTLLEPHLRMLARTSPRPRVEPDVDLLLHGSRTTAGAVTLVWRRDIELPEIEDPTERLAATNEILQLLPPSSLEGCEVPLREARMWLARGSIDVDTGDVEGGQVSSVAERAGERRIVVCWRGKGEDVERVSVARLAPGAVIVLRSDDGGYDAFGWAPDSSTPVPDLAERAFHRRTKRSITRVGLEPDTTDIVPGPSGFRPHRWARGIVFEQTETGRGSRIVETPIPLDAHSERVADKARQYAMSLGLEANVFHSAGLHHDDGKAHAGWQLQVNGGDPAALVQPPLAKGPFLPSPLSRLPRGWRHEAESFDKLMRANVSELVQWLVATHHGYARPFWPIPAHGIGLAGMMDRLQRAHGYWGLALFETVLRSADRKVSEEEMANG